MPAMSQTAPKKLPAAQPKNFPTPGAAKPVAAGAKPATPAKPTPKVATPAAPAAKKVAAAPAVITHKGVVSAPMDAINDILEGIRAGGDEGATLLGSDGHALKIRGVISTQCPGLDKAIGRGGVPLGRLSILHGAEGSGKTTEALHLVAEVQRKGGIAIYMDKEYKLDPDYAAGIGVDIKRLIISQPSYLEQVFATSSGTIQRAAKWRAKSGKRVPILIILDSMNAAITKAQFEGEWDDQHMAPQARVFSAQLPKLIPEVSKEDVALVWISQVRKKMNIQFGDDDEIAGGKAPRFYASLIIKFKRIGTVKVGDEKVGNRTVAECVKNQIAPPFRKADFTITYGRGIDSEMSLLELGIEAKVITKTGAWYDVGERRIGNGIVNSADVLREEPLLAAYIAKKLGLTWERA
jgi:recombination protein RecA